ncbi:hypothetical protein L207DRAFT_562960 [Hyaloscypha variabilis F]|uniref:2EXR domain-containing protein n=1 Tax=Hyaloscypha variabilis (strain UAMH 11265 / GT02V1 / F) TaxID=1149755 RepID=A0A2J6RZA8_HYAVF|nr:hypothetical protein L207DRAFT_562960 [Hyaloscypha variabilis F]
MDTSSLDPAGESLLNAGSEELGRFDGPPTDLKLEAIPPELVDAMDDSGITPKSEHQACFTLFPKLLFEIRTMIWDQICNEPRIVEVEVRAYRNPQRPKTSNIFDFSYAPPFDFGFTPLGPNPAILHVCKEARDQGLKHYSRLLQRPPGADHVPDTIIYMLPEDTLCILPPKTQSVDEDFYYAVTSGYPKNSFNSAVASASDQSIRRLVIPIPPTAALLEVPVIIILRCTCQLKEVVFVRNWEAREESLSNELSNQRGYANVRSLLEPAAGADVEGEALIKVLREKLDEFARQHPNDPIPQERQAKVLFRTLSWTKIAA